MTPKRYVLEGHRETIQCLGKLILEKANNPKVKYRLELVEVKERRRGK
jgi:hypothetical protein